MKMLSSIFPFSLPASLAFLTAPSTAWRHMRMSLSFWSLLCPWACLQKLSWASSYLSLGLRLAQARLFLSSSSCTLTAIIPVPGSR